jgi:HSP20 family protein
VDMSTALMPTAARPAQSVSELFDRIFGPVYSAFNGFGTPTYQGVPANVYEAGDTYQIALLVPGIEPRSIQVTALGKSITVAGAMQVATPERANALGEDFCPSQLTRQISLPVEVDAARIEATYTKGLLLVTAPKAEHAKPRQIQVKM